MSSGELASPLLRQFNFQENPFGLREPDREDRTRLSEYFFEHHHFASLLGNPSDPQSIIILARRGAGKTTLRQLIELNCRERRNGMEGVLDVPYTEFSRVIRQAAGGRVDIFQHTDEILRCAVVRLLESVNPNNVKNFTALSHGQRSLLKAYISHYSSFFDPADNGQSVNQLLQSIARENLDQYAPFDVSQRFAVDQPHQPGAANPVGFVPSRLLGDEQPNPPLLVSIPPLLQPIVNLLLELKQQSIGRLRSSSYIQLIRDFIAILTTLGYRAMYILVDRIDETSLFATPEDAAAFVKPLLTDLDLLEESKLAFRIFLPHHLEPNIEYRADRITVLHLVWSEDELLDLLARRLQSFSRGRISTMRVFCEPGLGSKFVEDFSVAHDSVAAVDLALVRASNNLPRNLIRRCLKLLQVYEARMARGEATPALISAADLNEAVAVELPVENQPRPAPPSPPPATIVPPPTFIAPAPADVPKRGLYIDNGQHLWRDGQQLDVSLAATEFNLLVYLCQHRNQICANEDIIRAVWKGDYADEVLRTAIRRLRQAVEYDATLPSLIITHRGRGIELTDGQMPTKKGPRR